LNQTFTEDYFLKYSALERVGRVEDIEHPIVREAFLSHQMAPAVELVSMADIPAGTGLGSSGAFTVGLLRSIYAFRRDHISAGDLAEEACHIEIERLNRPVGKQDQYIAAFGGLTCFDFQPDGSVETTPLGIDTRTLHDLEGHLMMFFTGYSRAADQVLSEQKSKSTDGDVEMIENLHTVKRIGEESREALERGDCEAFAHLMNEHWHHKRKRSTAMSNERIDGWYELAMANGALGGKLVGAGAGGFLLFYAKDPDLLRDAFREEGLSEVRFAFDHDGSTVVARD
jgi:D-glycero-alpha-D-manno-heptose-7-phosphate kinase